MIFLDDIAAVITICHHQYYFCWFLNFPISDPEHQRAKGNLKYFEFQLQKQKKAAEAEPEKVEERAKRETKEKKKPKPKVPSYMLPERKKYEMLCRGEGIKLVRTTKTKHKKVQFLTFKIQICFNSFVSCIATLSLRPPEGRAGFSVVTMIIIAIPGICWHLSNSKMSGTALTSSATLTSSQTKKSRRSNSLQSPE